MTTLADILLKAAECIGGMRLSTSTAAGSTTTLVDSTLNEPVDFFNDGTLFFITGALAGKTAIITDWALTGGTFTFPAQSVAPGNGALYGVLDNRFPREALVQALNLALEHLGPVTAEYDNAAFVLVDDQDEYTLPAGVSGVARVQFAELAASPWNWLDPEHNWEERGGTLYLWDEENYRIWRRLYAGNRIRLFYNPPHTRKSLDADVIPEGIEPIRLAWETVWQAAVTRRSKDPETKDLVVLAEAKRKELAGTYPLGRMRKDSKWSGY